MPSTDPAHALRGTVQQSAAVNEAFAKIARGYHDEIAEMAERVYEQVTRSAIPHEFYESVAERFSVPDLPAGLYEPAEQAQRRLLQAAPGQHELANVASRLLDSLHASHSVAVRQATDQIPELAVALSQMASKVDFAALAEQAAAQQTNLALRIAEAARAQQGGDRHWDEELGVELAELVGEVDLAEGPEAAFAQVRERVEASGLLDRFDAASPYIALILGILAGLVVLGFWAANTAPEDNPVEPIAGSIAAGKFVNDQAREKIDRAIQRRRDANETTDEADGADPSEH